LERIPGCNLNIVDRSDEESWMSLQPKTYAPSELGRLTGLSPDSIRHYERVGILRKAARTAAGYRRYTDDALERVRLVQSALKIGFTLHELADVFRVRDAGGAPCQHVFNLTQQKLGDVVAQIAELRRTERYMRQVLKNWATLLAKAGPKNRALLLRSLPRAGAPRRRSTKQRLIASLSRSRIKRTQAAHSNCNAP
jgi:DNA-binding transcriptional MerR regulator